MDEDAVRAMWCETLRLDPGGFEALDPGSTCKPPEASEPVAAVDLPTVRLSQEGLGVDPAATVPLPEAEQATGNVGPAFACYEIVDEVGRGGMGVVYRARQRSLEREVAVKRVKDSADQLQSRFTAEARVTGTLDHPNIVPVHDLGHDGSGPLLIMKLVDGLEWRALLHPTSDAARERAAGLELVDHLRILQTVCNAVAFAHSRAIVHCDLKPENVMVGAYGEVLVMDWGVAVDVRDLGQGTEPVAQHRSTVEGPRGTPCYMAPELASGEGEAIGAWTDVFLLGAILHELLTGRPPHQGATLPNVLVRAIRADPPEFGSDVPAELAGLCRAALAGEPAQRPASAQDFRELLEAFLEHRESAKITESAEAVLQRCLDAPDADAHAVYADFAEAVAGFHQARLLWTDNERAIAGERAARLAYARFALANGDLGLADAQAARIDEPDAALLEAIGAARDARRRAEEEATRARESERRALRRAERMLSQAYTEKARLALAAGDVLAARALSARALVTAESREARELLFSLGEHRTGCLWSSPRHPALQAPVVTKGRWLAVRERGRAGLGPPPIQVWDLAATPPVHHRDLDGPPGEDLWFQDDGSVATFDAEGRVQAWDPRSGDPLEEPTLARAPAGDLPCGLEGERLWVEIEGQRFVGSGHEEHLTDVAWAPDGQTLATSSYDFDVLLWRRGELAPGRYLEGHQRAVVALDCHPAGGHVVSACFGKELRVWDMATGHVTQTLKTSRSASRVRFRPDGALLAAALRDGKVAVWTVTAGVKLELRDELETGHWLYDLAWSPSGDALVAGGEGGRVHAWDGEGGAHRSWDAGADVRALAFHPDGKRLACGTTEGKVLVLDAESWSVLLELEAPVAGSVAFTPCGGQVCAGGQDGVVRFWDLASGRATLALRGHRDAVTRLAFAPDAEGGLATVSKDGTLRRWEWRRQAEARAVRGPEGSLEALAIHPQGWAVSGSRAGDLTRWASLPGFPERAPADLGAHGSWVWDIAISAAGDQLASAGLNGEVRVWRLGEGAMTTLSGLEGGARATAFHPRGDALATAGGEEDPRVCVWSLPGGERLHTLAGHTSAIHEVAFHPTGDLLASVSADRSARIWSTASGECLQVLEHPESVHTLGFAPDGSMATIAADHTLRLWRQSGSAFAEVRQLTPRADARACAFDPASRYLAVTGAACVIEVFDLERNASDPALVIEGHEGEVGALCFAHEGLLLSASHDGVLRAWALSDALGAPAALEARVEASTGLSVRDLELVTLPRNHLVPQDLDPEVFEGRTRGG